MFRHVTVLMLAATVCALAAARAPAQKPSQLPADVTLIVLPPGGLRIERVFRDNQPLVRLSVGKTIVEARALFLGDGKGALQVEALKEGMHWVPVEVPPGQNGRGTVVRAVQTYKPGTVIGAEAFLTVDQLRAGSVYVMTPSINFEFGPGARARR